MIDDGISVCHLWFNHKHSLYAQNEFLIHNFSNNRYILSKILEVLPSFMWNGTSPRGALHSTQNNNDLQIIHRKFYVICTVSNLQWIIPWIIMHVQLFWFWPHILNKTSKYWRNSFPAVNAMKKKSSFWRKIACIFDWMIPKLVCYEKLFLAMSLTIS